MIVVLAVVAAAVVLGVQAMDSSDDVDGTSAGSEATAATQPPTTQPARVTQPDALAAYCAQPGAKWDEVPPHVPGEPVRMQVEVAQGAEQANGYNGDTFSSSSWPHGGSTVISPHTDGLFTDEPLVLARTRAVACVHFLARDGLGQQCDYGDALAQFRNAPDFTLELAKNRFEIVVYELHSGGVLHRGEIWSDTSHCPDKASDEGTGQVVTAISDVDVLAWIGSHFVDGKPA